MRRRKVKELSTVGSSGVFTPCGDPTRGSDRSGGTKVTASLALVSPSRIRKARACWESAGCRIGKGLPAPSDFERPTVTTPRARQNSRAASFCPFMSTVSRSRRDRAWRIRVAATRSPKEDQGPCAAQFRELSRTNHPSTHVAREFPLSPSRHRVQVPAAAARAGREIIKHTARSSYFGGPSGVKGTVKEDASVPSEISLR